MRTMSQSSHPFRKLLFTLLAFSISLFATAQTPDANGIIYVTTNGTGIGTSWNDAMSDLQSAINAPGVQKVFVAIGNYDVPLPGSFTMKKDVAIYGGFDPINNIKTLDDNRILPNNGTAEGSVLNGQNVVTVIDNTTVDLTLSATAVLDGFTIKNGYGNNGGGISNVQGPGSGNWAIFRNLVVKDNTSTSFGGGIFNYSAVGNYTNVIVKNNTAASAGGVYMNNGASNSLTNVQITNNTATDKAVVY